MRSAHKLGPNHLTRVPRHYFVYDCETQFGAWNIPNGDENKKEREHTLRLGVIHECDTRKGNMRRKSFTFYKADEFWDWILPKIHPKQTAYLFSHNQQFDAPLVKMFSQLPSRDWSLTKSAFRAGLFIVDWENGNHSSKNVKGDLRTLECLDTLNYFRTSIESIGRTLKLPKGLPICSNILNVGLSNQFMSLSIPHTTAKVRPSFYTSATDTQLESYCERDVMITDLAIANYISFLVKNDLGNFQPTMPSQAFTAFRHKFMRHGIFIHDNERAIALERASYRGGRNECFRIGRVHGKIYVLDFNSLYPSVMYQHEYPTKLVSYHPQNNIRTLRTALDADYLVIADLTVKMDMPLVGIKKERLIFPTGTFNGTFCTPEIQMLLERGCVRSVGRMCTYEHAPIFDEYVKFFYEQRLESKLSGNDWWSTCDKDFLNELYGKWGQRKQHDEILASCSPDIVGVENKSYHGHRYQQKSFGGKIFRTESSDEESENSFPAIASHCTAYARQKLLGAIETAGWANVYYGDTDSIFTNDIGYDALLPIVDKDKLGYLKLEYTADDLAIHGCKDYFINGKRKIKGISIGNPNTQQISDTEYSCLYFDKLLANVRHNNIDTVVERRRHKKLSREYTKGVVDGNGIITPIVYT